MSLVGETIVKQAAVPTFDEHPAAPQQMAHLSSQVSVRVPAQVRVLLTKQGGGDLSVGGSDRGAIESLKGPHVDQRLPGRIGAGDRAPLHRCRV